jgi:hypothetical protein
MSQSAWDTCIVDVGDLITSIRASHGDDPSSLAMSQRVDGSVTAKVSYRLSRTAFLEVAVLPEYKDVRVTLKSTRTSLSAWFPVMGKTLPWVRACLSLPFLAPVLLWLLTAVPRRIGKPTAYLPHGRGAQHYARTQPLPPSAG